MQRPAQPALHPPDWPTQPAYATEDTRSRSFEVSVPKRSLGTRTHEGTRWHVAGAEQESLMRKLLAGGLVVAALVALAGLTNRQVISCPFCPAPSLTLSEQVAQADAIVLVQWVSGKPAEGQSAGDTT